MRSLRARRASIAGALVACAVVSMAACVSSDFDDGVFACTSGTQGACPDGLLCASDGVCRVRDIDASNALDAVDTSTDAADGRAMCPSVIWTKAFTKTPLAVAVADSGRVFAAGRAGPDAWLAEIDPCSGAILRDRTFPAAGRETRFNTLAVTATEVVAAGAAGAATDGPPSTLLHGRFGLDLTTKVLADPAVTAAGEATRIAVSSDGTLFLAGAAPAPDPGFVAHVGATTCMKQLPSEPGGLVASSGGTALLLRGGGPAVLEVVDATCKVGAAGKDPITVGSGTTAAGLVTAPKGVVALGTAKGSGSNTFLWLAGDPVAPDASVAAWTVATFDPNALDPDTARMLATDGDALFVAASQRANGSGTPTLYRYAVDIKTSSQSQWTAAPFGALLLLVTDVAAAPRAVDAVYVAGSSGGSGSLARCTKAGVCSP